MSLSSILKRYLWFIQISTIYSLYAEPSRETHQQQSQHPPYHEGKRELALSEKSNDISFRAYGDFLYLNASEDHLRYSMTRSYSFNPEGKAVNQQFRYRPAGRVGIFFPIYDSWMCDISYTYLDSSPGTRRITDAEQYLYANMGSLGAMFAGFSNTQCGQVDGKWRMKFQIVDLDFNRDFLISRALSMTPIFGVKGCFIKQSVNVHYGDFYLDPYLTSLAYTSKVVGHSNVWGVGPSIGGRIGIFFPGRWEIFARGVFSTMFGEFDLKTKYLEVINGPDASLKDNIHSLFTVSEIQVGLSKTKGYCTVAVGWETQMWWRQMRMNWFSNIPQAPEGGDLSLYGPFVRLLLSF